MYIGGRKEANGHHRGGSQNIALGPMGPHGSPWVPMGSHGFPWVPMGSHGFPWVPMGPHGLPWALGGGEPKIAALPLGTRGKNATNVARADARATFFAPAAKKSGPQG